MGQHHRQERVTMKYKTLVFTDERKDTLGPYVYIDGPDIYGTIVPSLITEKSTMDLVKELNPNVDFSGIQMITVELRHTD